MYVIYLHGSILKVVFPLISFILNKSQQITSREKHLSNVNRLNENH